MDVYTGLADPVRRALLLRLAAGPRRVVDLAAEHDVSRPAISKHLRHLNAVGLVSASDRGRERHYALRPESLAPVAELLQELVDVTPAGRLSDPALDALDTEVRRTVRDRRTAARATLQEETA